MFLNGLRKPIGYKEGSSGSVSGDRRREPGRKREGMSGGPQHGDSGKAEITAAEGGWEKVRLLFAQIEEGILKERQLTSGAVGLRSI